MTEEELRKNSEIRDALEHVVGVMLRNPSNTGWSAAGRIAKQLSEELTRRMATAWLAEQARHEVRVISLTAERQAEARISGQTSRRRPQPDSSGWVHGSSNKRNGGVFNGCTCEVCTRVRAEDRAALTDLHAKLHESIETYASHLRMEWTEELLKTTFSLSDGTRVLWGDATIDQHVARAEMLRRNVEAVAETAARHHAAITAITNAQVTTLNELIRHEPTSAAS